MSTKIGRVTLTTPLDISVTARRNNETVAAPTGKMTPGFVSAGGPMYRLEGRQIGSTAQAELDALMVEARRLGSVYVSDTDSLIPSGWYELGPPEYQKPGGAPRKRPWTLEVEGTDAPWIVRQAEDDLVAGVDTADTSGDVEEDAYVDYTTTGSYADVLRPFSVAGAEAINLPQGTWRMLARMYAVTTATAQARWKTEDDAGATLATGSDITVTPAGAWTDFDMGTLTVAAADHKDNWYSVQVKDVTNPGSHVRIDRVWILPGA